jgi:diamine N-acetyltransferase
MYYGKLVCLRPLEMSDFDEIVKYQNNWHLRRWTGVPLPKSRKSVEQWLEKASVSDPIRDGTMVLAITDKKTGVFLGITRFYDVKFPHYRASLGIGIQNPDDQSRGYGTDATLVMLWVAFNVLGLHSVYLDTMEHNERAIHVAEKSGFRRVGMFRETEFIDGEFKGLVYLDILRREFFERYPPGVLIGEK